MTADRRTLSLDAVALLWCWHCGDQAGIDAILAAADLEHARSLAAMLAGGLWLELHLHQPERVERIIWHTRALVLQLDQDQDQDDDDDDDDDTAEWWPPCTGEGDCCTGEGDC